MSMLDLIKRRYRQLIFGKYGWFGDYPDWPSAQKSSRGYDDMGILEKVRESTLKVKNGEAAYERDSVIFERVEYSWPLLSALLWVSSKNEGRLNVLDFGGSLGSSYFQNRLFLDSLKDIRWNVVEQASFVECGRRDIEDSKLRFFLSPKESVASAGFPDIVLLSCVLPYLEKPYQVIEEILDLNIPYIMIDNTYFNDELRDRICVQRVPPDIYKASMPCWFLNYNGLKTFLEKSYSVVTEHVNNAVIFLDGKPIEHRGMLLKRNK